MTTLDRRRFLAAGAATAIGAVVGPAFRRAAGAAPARPGPSPYGPLAATPDPNGLLLPAGFTSRVVARSGAPVAGTAHVWPPFPDGAAVFPTDDGGWHYVVNSEVPGSGGVSAIRFASDGRIIDAYRILSGTSLNCAGGPTPWGTWLSCEEMEGGQVWECDPTRPGQGLARPAMGRFVHEAVAVDPVGRRLYLTEDRPDGRFYRFTPSAYPDLSAGQLEVAVVADNGDVTWLPVPDPLATTMTTRTQVPESTAFRGGEGCWYGGGSVYFTTKGDNRVWVHDVSANTIKVLYDAAELGPDAPLTGVDNIVVSSAGDLYVAEDGGNMEINIITADGVVAPILRVVGNDESEITGPVFDPTGTRLYFSSQRGPAPRGLGITYEVTGPFRRRATAAGPTTPPQVQPPTPPTTAALTAVRSRAPQLAPAELPATGDSAGTTWGGLLLAALGGLGLLARRRTAGAAVDDDGS